MILTIDQINSIAPDPPSVKAGNKIFTKTNWLVFKSERAVWSEIQGSGKKPYYTQIDSNNLAFKCSCPSRKFPCKHGLGLGYFIANNTIEAAENQEEPLWVKEWIDKRLAKKTAPKVEKPVDLEKLKAKKEDKWKNAEKDIQQIDLWLKDFIKNGILELPNLKPSYWEGLMARMVDAKLPGINTFFRALADLTFEAKWEEKALEILGQIHLVIQTIKKHKNLPTDFKQELAMLLGWNMTKKELLQDEKTEVVDDEWIVTKVYRTKTEALESQKIFLFGLKTKRQAYILEFAFGSSFFEDRYIDGEIIKAKLAFFPGIQKNRAILKLKGVKPKNYEIPKASNNLKTLNEKYIQQNIAYPWVFEAAFYLANANVVHKNNTFYLIDELDYVVELINFSFSEYINILSISQGHFFDAFFLRTPDGYQLMSFVYNQKLTAIHE